VNVASRVNPSSQLGEVTMNDVNVAANIGVVGDADFERTVRESPRPVLVKFEAAWCGPCQAMKPMIHELASEYAGQLTVATVDVESSAQTAQRVGVRGVPTVMLFKQGSIVGQHVGLPKKAQLVALIERALT
jgi:thioredoxin 1